jgi:hypothetical protein
MRWAVLRNSPPFVSPALQLLLLLLLTAAPHPVRVWAQPTVVTALDPLRVRSIDGTGNNLQFPTEYGAVDSGLARIPAGAAYSDGVDAPARADAPSARNVSAAVFRMFYVVCDTCTGLCVCDSLWLFDPAAYHGSAFTTRSASSLLQSWGQFIAQDIIWTQTNATDPLPIPVPLCDPQWDTLCTGTVTFGFTRAVRIGGVRSAPVRNFQTHWLDASSIYGWSTNRMNLNREFAGGRVRMVPSSTALTLVLTCLLQALIPFCFSCVGQ